MDACNTLLFSLILHAQTMFLQFPASYANSCNDFNWEYFNGSCYSFGPQGAPDNSLSWFEARRTCQLYGGDLASVNSEEELNFLKNLKSILGIHSKTWIGLSRVEQTNWTWSDGNTYKFVYEKFNAIENINEFNACICTLKPFEYWDDDHCSNNLGFVCKTSSFETKPGSNILINGVCPEGFVSDSMNRKCYYVGGLSHGGKVNESEARKMCQSMVSAAPVNLASIHSQTDQDLVNLIMENISSDIWIGIHNRFRFHTYMWEDYSEMSFQNWNLPHIFTQSEKFNTDLQTKCGTIKRYPGRHGDQGEWTVAPCDEKHAYLCQTIKSPFKSRDNNSQLNEWLIVNTSDGNFVVTNESMTWQQASVSCMESNRNLARILDMFEMSKVNFAIRAMKIELPVWIGMKFDKEKSQYLWTENVPVDTTFWSPGQPTHADAEKCVILKDNKWFEKDCTEQFPFVCQSKSNKISAINKEDINRKLECPEKSMRPFGDSCFLFKVQDQVTWLGAHNMCRLQGMQLASVTSKLDHDFLLSEVKAINTVDEFNDRRHIWIGMYRDVDGRFFWSDDSPVQYIGEVEFDATFQDFKQINTFCFSLDVASGHWLLENCENNQHSFICESEALQAAPEELNVITLTLIVTGVCMTVLFGLILIIKFSCKNVTRSKIVKTEQATDESSNTGHNFRNATSGDYTTIEDVSEMMKGDWILNDDAYNIINDEHTTDDTEYVTPVCSDTPPPLPDRGVNKIKWDIVKEEILYNESSPVPVSCPCESLDDDGSYAVVDDENSPLQVTPAMLLFNLKKTAHISLRNCSFNIAESNRINVDWHCHRELSPGEKQKSYYWVPDGAEMSSCNIDVGVDDKRLGVQKIETDVEDETNYWIPDGAYDSSNAFLKSNSLNVDYLYYASLSDYSVGPSKKDDRIRNIFCGMDTLLMNRHLGPIQTLEVERNICAGHIFQDSLSSEISSQLTKHNSICDNKYARERYYSDRNIMLNCSNTHDFDVLKDDITYHKLYDVVHDLPIRHPEFAHSIGLVMNARGMQHYRNDVMNGNATLNECPGYHRQSDSNSCYGYWIPDGADFDMYTTDSLPSFDTSFIETCDYGNINSNNNWTENPKPCTLKTRTLNSIHNEAISQHKETRERNFLDDRGEKSGIVIHDANNFRDEETIAPAGDKDNEALIQRLFPIDDHGYSIPI